MTLLCINISGESDIAEAARQARQIAKNLGFTTTSSHYVATVASELAANLFIHAGGGVFEIENLVEPTGLELATVDDGPGIADVEQALEEGYSTAGGLGCGLPGVKRLMDELQITPRPGGGTIVKARKWL